MSSLHTGFSFVRDTVSCAILRFWVIWGYCFNVYEACNHNSMLFTRAISISYLCFWPIRDCPPRIQSLPLPITVTYFSITGGWSSWYCWRLSRSSVTFCRYANWLGWQHKKEMVFIWHHVLFKLSKLLHVYIAFLRRVVLLCSQPGYRPHLQQRGTVK